MQRSMPTRCVWSSRVCAHNGSAGGHTDLDRGRFTDKHLRERIGTIVRINTKTCSLMCDGEQWRVSPAILRKIIDL